MAMTATKTMPCCSRINRKLEIAKAEFQGAARRAVYVQSKGRSTVAALEKVERHRAAVRFAESCLTEHEAQHAGEES